MRGISQQGKKKTGEINMTWRREKSWRSWRDCIGVKLLALYRAKPGSIPGITYGPPSTITEYGPKPNQNGEEKKQVIERNKDWKGTLEELLSARVQYE